jgi:hypothetical protein
LKPVVTKEEHMTEIGLRTEEKSHDGQART